jgi:hypothetical protein
VHVVVREPAADRVCIAVTNLRAGTVEARRRAKSRRRKAALPKRRRDRVRAGDVLRRGIRSGSGYRPARPTRAHGHGMNPDGGGMTPQV